MPCEVCGANKKTSDITSDTSNPITWKGARFEKGKQTKVCFPCHHSLQVAIDVFSKAEYWAKLEWDSEMIEHTDDAYLAAVKKRVPDSIWADFEGLRPPGISADRRKPA